MYAKKEVNNLFFKIAQKIILTNVLNVFLQNNNKLILWPPYHSDEYFGAPHDSIPWLCIYTLYNPYTLPGARLWWAGRGSWPGTPPRISSCVAGRRPQPS